jgi:tubulin polyglutamylase TTLL6/13
MGANLNRMRKLLPDLYDFYPDTWIMPEDISTFQKVTQEHRNRTYIVKPNGGCQGQGIFFTRKAQDIPKEGRWVAQRYMNRPLLIDGFKFDLRIYVLITSVTPLRVYVFEEGLARFCTTPYQGISTKNTEDVYQHLTNYAINKNNASGAAPPPPPPQQEEAIPGEAEINNTGLKRSIKSIKKWLDDNGFDGSKFWKETEEAIVKTLLAAAPAQVNAPEPWALNPQNARLTDECGV